MSPVTATQPTALQGEYTDPNTLCSLRSLSQPKSSSSSSTPSTPPLPQNSDSGGKEPTLTQQTKSSTTISSLLQQQQTDVCKPDKKTNTFSTASATTKSELRNRFDAPLTNSTTLNHSSAPPRPYRPGLVPQPSSLRPHCLARERLKLWLPSPDHARLNREAEHNGNHPVTEEQVNRILEVLGASWAEKTKEVYGAGLLAYHVYCDSHNIPDPQRAPISANILLAFLSSCAGSYSGSTLSNFAAGLRAWHLLHGLQWKINPDELRAILEGASRLAPPSSKRPLREPFRVDTLQLLHALMDPENPRDAAIFACITVVFYCVARLGEFTVQSIKQFDPTKHITRANVSHLHDINGLPVTKFHIPWTKVSPMGEDAQCAPLEGVTDPIKALQNHFRLNPAGPDSHLFAWFHPSSGLRPLSRAEVVKRISSLASMHNLPNLKGHSLRIGGTLHYLLRGTPFDVVKTIGRWAGDSFTIYLRQHAMILAPYLNDTPALLEHFTRYTMPPVR